jgi:hypothetical protein
VPEFLHEDRAKNVTAEDNMTVQRERFTANIIGGQPGVGDAAAEHVGPSDAILVVV